MEFHRGDWLFSTAGVKTGCMGGPSATSPDVKIFLR